MNNLAPGLLALSEYAIIVQNPFVQTISRIIQLFGQSLCRHVVCNVPVSCKANSDWNQFEVWLDSIIPTYSKI